MKPLRPFDGRRFAQIAFLIWMLLSGVLVALAWRRFASVDFYDPDDVLRLLQVRDLIAGQSWFDLTQYRINPPLGGPMHWSRLVDLPIAALILLFRPFAGPAQAEMLAAATVPLLLLGALFAAFGFAVWRLGSAALALLSMLFLTLTGFVLMQFVPLRIDHHGWQILMSAVAFAGALDPRQRRGGLVAGAAIAGWLQISTEALPYAALWGACFGIHFVADDRAWRRLSAYLSSLAGLSAILLLAFRGPQMFQPWCDAMSPAYLLPLVGAAVFTIAAHRLVGSRTLARRCLILFLAGTGAAMIFLVAGRQCLAGPFATLDPIVYDQWYLHIKEGRPIWEQGLDLALLILLPSLAGLGGSLWAVLDHRGADRVRWLMVLGLSFGALCVAIMVARAVGVAHLLALPGNAWLIIRLYRPIPAFRRPVARILSTSALAILTPVGLAMVSAIPGEGKVEKPDPPGPACTSVQGLAPLRRLPPATVIAPLDIGADILLRTRHSVVGTSHHRNKAGMRASLEAFILPEPQARAAVMGTRAAYLAWCPGENEVDHYRNANPNAFMRRLESGRLPPWLKPVPSDMPIRLYRVVR